MNPRDQEVEAPRDLTRDQFVTKIVGLLEESVMTLRTGRPHRSAWRVADAGGLLRTLFEQHPDLRGPGGRPLVGLEAVTGLDVLLPRIPPGVPLWP